MSIRIFIGADIVPTDTNFETFSSGHIESLVDNKISDVLSHGDYRVFNLEVPLVDKKAPIKKCGPNLIAPADTVNGIKGVNPTLLTIANNHIMDHGQQGLESTLKVLKESNIDYIGSGNDIYEAQNPYVFSKDCKTVGVYACCEHEFSIADEDKPGANPFDPLESLDHISALKSKCDYVIVLYHGGKEHYRYPSPLLQKVCRKMCDKGADLVVCQHSHCIGCEEKYNSSVIVYGQGNFLFDHSESEFWKTSLLIDAEFGDEMKINYVPLCKNGNGVRMATEEESTEIINAFNNRGEQIKVKGFIEEEYARFAEKMSNSYINALRNNGLIYKIIYKLSLGKYKQKYTEKNLLKMLNTFECEAHRELFITWLKDNAKRGKESE